MSETFWPTPVRLVDPKAVKIRIGDKEFDGFLDGSFFEFSDAGVAEELFIRSQIPAAPGSCMFLELGELETSRVDARHELERHEIVGVQGGESDDDFRNRLLYVAGTDRRINIAMGTELDAIAEEYGLRRR